jgi:drug/metabolite transporter (DMT)-like permease
MRSDKPTWLYFLLFACIGAGLATLLPFRNASETSILGYRALCTFSPISTVLLFYAGLLAYGKIRRG